MRRRKWLVAIAVTACALVVAFTVWRLWFPGRAFDPVAWRDDNQVQQGVRLAMADRLVARRTLQGKTRAEVLELLGEPTPTGRFHDWDLVYWLGPERSYFSIDSEWLVVRFAPDGRATEYGIVRD
jgi:outer membrane protein assembly factor BamE (lipoprotein component of BamABCDE complex)